MKEKIKAVIEVLQRLDIQSTYTNLQCLLGSINSLAEVLNELEQKEVAKNGRDVNAE